MTRKFTVRRRNGEVVGYRTGGDSTTLKRDLGLKPFSRYGRKEYKRKGMSEKRALAYANALGLDPVEIGL